MRAAVSIREAFVETTRNLDSIDPPVDAWRRIENSAKRYELAERFGWPTAERRTRRDIVSAIQTLRAELGMLELRINKSESFKPIPSLRDVYHDLIALEHEFVEVEIDLRQSSLSAVTDEIVLDGLFLGAFEINLFWKEIHSDQSGRYCVVARDPNPPDSNDEVHHPHVLNSTLCEGDGHQPIQNALAEGRLLDFFFIVRNILRSYNPDSAYVSLSEWNGLPCSDCGASACEDERYCCERCECTVCRECYRPCSDCNDALCNDCTTMCSVCDDEICKRCTQHCELCSLPLCDNCLNESNHCEKCHEKKVETEAKQADTAIQPDGVGEVVVSA